MGSLNDWDVSDANNNAVPPDGWPENMNYSEVNNTGRAVQGTMKRFFSDINGSLVGAGAADAYTVTLNEPYTAYFNGMLFACSIPASTLTANPTINVNGLGAVPIIEADGGALAVGDLVLGGIYNFRYDGASMRVGDAGSFLPLAGGTVTGALTVLGPFTSVGIVDQASGQRVEIFNSVMQLGAAGAGYSIGHDESDQFISIDGGNTGAFADINIFGGTHVSRPGDIDMRSNSQVFFAWNESDGTLILSTGSGGKSTALTLNANQSILLGNSLYLPEVSAGSDIPNRGQLYVNASNELVYRDENGVELALGVGAVAVEEADHQRAGHHQFFVGSAFQGQGNVQNFVAESAWESFGPTGSGADNTWPSLDLMPVNATALIVSIGSEIGADGGGNGALEIYVRQTGSSQTVNINTQVVDLATDDVNGEIASNSNMVTIPLDASQRFDLFWAASNDASRSISLGYRGFVTD